jgi:SpoVK/Ycf46/Vps4 family AAA+-type ATPase
MSSLCSEASLVCIRELPVDQLRDIHKDKARNKNFNKLLIELNQSFSSSFSQLRSITIDDFRKSVAKVKASVSQDDLQQYIAWNQQFGSTG